jgi:hypothetical protein
MGGNIADAVPIPVNSPTSETNEELTGWRIIAIFRKQNA